MDLNHKPPYHFSDGALILIDKPREWTSFQVVKKVRGLTEAKTGHAGTLDPLATGLLILATGKYTKKIELIQAQAKTYIGSFKLGATTASFDAETNEVKRSDTIPTLNKVTSLAKSMTGVQQQIPPMYSALKKEGKKLYELARKGKTVKRYPREITIFSFEITEYNYPIVHFEISCTKGTYIRSIANDFGEALQVGAYLNSLRRTKIGDYKIEDAWQIDQFETFVKTHAT